jgi:FkbM family methyltransferase
MAPELPAQVSVDAEEGFEIGRLSGLLAPVTVRVRSGPLAGWRLSVASGSRLVGGRYEPETAQAFAANIHAGDFVLDVGAHYGYLTLLAARLAGPEGLVWAFEPRPSNLRILGINLRANRLATVLVREQAVAAKSGTLHFDTRHGSGTGRLAETGDTMVSVAAIDDLKLPRAPSFLKIDIEGGEIDALKGAEQTIGKHRPTLLIATHGRSIRREVETMLHEWGYELSTLAGDVQSKGWDILAVRPSGSRPYSTIC